MPLPIGRVIKTIGQIALPAAMTYGTVQSTQDRVHQGQNPVFAAAVEGTSLVFNIMLQGPLAIAATVGLPLARAGAAIITDQVRAHNNFIRQARTPWSQRFEHTEMSARAQANGLRAIGSAWGHANMGSEAALFARRYGR